ncbi:MAG: family 16 glycoside hydrolase [Planctomyces sp.]
MKLVSRLLFLVAAILPGTAALGQQYSSLLPDRSLSQWMLPDGADVTQGWTFDTDGSLHLSGKGNNILTREEFGDFDLWFEYRISEKGNSGLKYRVMTYGIDAVSSSRSVGLKPRLSPTASERVCPASNSSPSGR